MIYGGEHMEWPEDYFYDTAYDKEAEMEQSYFDEDETEIMRDWLKQKHKEAEMELDREYEEAMWKQVSRDGPPKDDDIEWVKAKVYELAFALGRDYTKMYIDQVAAARNQIWEL